MSKICFVIDLNDPNSFGSVTDSENKIMGLCFYSLKALGVKGTILATYHSVVSTDGRPRYTKLALSLLRYYGWELGISDTFRGDDITGYMPQETQLQKIKTMVDYCRICNSAYDPITSYHPQGEVNVETEYALAKIGIKNITWLPSDPMFNFKPVVPTADYASTPDPVALLDGSDIVLHISTNDMPLCNSYAGYMPDIAAFVKEAKARGYSFCKMNEF